MADEAAASIESRKDAGKGEAGKVRMWINAVELAEKHESKWREAAEKVVKRYRMEEERKGKGFPILYANTETLLPAVYNSQPVPDVRRRFGDADPTGKQAAQALERAISHCCDEYDFHQVMCDAVKDMGLLGRGVARVRYDPLMKDGEVAYQQVRGELVQWNEVTFGPTRRWDRLPWLKFDHLLTREQLVKLSPKFGDLVPLTHTCEGHEEKKDAENKLPDIFKRALVWEIWDKDTREVRWLAPHFKRNFLRTEPDPLRLEGFYPIPRPLYAIWTTDSMVPIEPFRIYKDQADELDEVTRRIIALVKVCRARGIYDASLEGAFSALKNSDDGVYVPTSAAEAKAFTMEAGLDKAVWSWPLETIVATLKQLYENREQIKAVIFELTGIADIMRGQTEAQETKGAQQLKTQWGTLRIAPLQQEVQRYARDLIRLKAEIIAEHFKPEVLSMISGVQITPDVHQLMRTDALRSYRIDIETDSTIRADVQRAQEQIGRFVEGTGAYFTAMGPAVTEGAMPKDVAIDLYASFARQFKLGKQAEDALDRWSEMAKQEAQNPQPQVDPEMQKLQMQQQMEQQKLQADMQAKQAELELKKQEMAAKLEFEQQKMQLEAQKHAQQMEMDQAKHGADMQMKGQELQLKEREGQMNAQLKAAEIADGQMARQEERQMVDAKSAGLPEGQKSMDFMGETGEALKVATDQINTLAQAVAKVTQMVTDLKASNDDSVEGADRIMGADGRMAGLRMKRRSGKVVEIPIGRA
jgi:hypothetical protein